MARSWYAYKGSGDPYLPANYSLATIKPLCVNGPILCAIYTFDGGEAPLGPFSTNIRRYIANGLVSQLSQPQAPVNAKKYVYLKTGV
jgi:hypothetical protein